MKRLPSAAAMVLPLLIFSMFSGGAESVVTINAIPPPGTLTPGQPAVITLELSIRYPYHINSNQPLEDYLIPTTVEFDPRPGVNFGEVTFPPAPVKKLPVLDQPMAVYEGTINITSEFTAESDLSTEAITITGRVRYQACDDTSCLPPVREPFSLQLPVQQLASSRSILPTIPESSSSDTPEFIQDEAEASGTGENSPPVAVEMDEQSPGATAAYFEAQGIVLTFMLVFLGGLALNLTPCVYPMIPITISYFGGQSQGKKGNLIFHSIIYVIGMALTYSVLGVIAALTGSLFGAAMQYPPVLVLISLIFVLLSLSMFDVYELRMPAFLNRMAGSSYKGLFGTFFMGLTVGIIAAPCIGPFVLSLLTYVGTKGSAVLGFALFFVLALGLGLPFLVLGIFSGSISSLPRSGAWMVWVRKIFGFILLAMAVYFLKPLFPTQLFYQLTIALLLFLAGIYMAWIEPTKTEGKGFSFLRNIVGLVFFSIALYAAATGIQSYIAETVSAVKSQPAGEIAVSTDAIQWFPYSAEVLARASQEAKPVFIDFYADWCAPCKQMDRETYATPEVIAASKDFVMLKVDLTLAGDAQSEMLREKYQARGVPTLVFLKPNGQEITDLRGSGFEPKDVFLLKMNRAIQLSAR